MAELHSILKRQLHRFNLNVESFTPELKNFLEAVNQSYIDADQDLISIKRSLDLSSQEFREIQQTIKEALNKYQSLINNLTIAVIQTDTSGNIIAANPACAKILEMSSVDELLQRKISDFYKNIEDRRILLEKIQNNTAVNNHELTMITNKGREITVLVNIAIKKEMNGKIIFDAIVEDITLRKNAEKALQEAHDLLEMRVAERTKELESARVSLVNVLNELMNEKKAIQKEKAKYDTILSGIGDGVWVIDPQGNILLTNAAFEKMVGIKKEEILYKPITTITLEDAQHQIISLEKRPAMVSMKNRSTILHPITDPVFVVRKDGTRFPATMLSTPLFQNNELFGGVAIIRDITMDLEREKQKNEFISIASHELRTPLTAIDGIVSMILAGEYGPLSENIKEPLIDVNSSSERLIELINDLLNLSRIQEGRLLPELSDFPIKAKIQYTCDLLNLAAKQKGIQIKIGHIDDINVQADSQKIGEIFENLIGNAIKFTDNGVITLFTEIDQEQLRIHIHDTGIGISPDDQSKLFKKFAQISMKSSRPAGTGLGLYISKEMLKKMGGDLWLEKSEPGVGSDFCFSLPISGTQTAQAAKDVLTKQNSERKQD